MTGIALIPTLLFRTLRQLSILSLFGMIVSILVVVATVGIASYDLHQSTFGGHCDDDVQFNRTKETFQWDQFPMAFATIAVSFGGHAVYPSLEQHMTHPQDWNMSLNISYIILFFGLYLPVAFFGYLAWGVNALSPILSNFPRCGSVTAVSIVSKIFVTFHVICTYPVLMNVVLLPNDLPSYHARRLFFLSFFLPLCPSPVCRPFSHIKKNQAVGEGRVKNSYHHCCWLL